MATTSNTETPGSPVRDALSEHASLHAGARKTLEYVTGTRTKRSLSLQADVLPACVVTGGQLALRYQHDKTTEYVFATGDTTMATATAVYRNQDGRQVTDLQFPVTDLERERGLPDRDDIVHVAYAVPCERPASAHPRDGGDA